MKFVYELSGAGWADGFIEINSNIAQFSASYLTDALHDLLKSLISIIPQLVQFPIQKAEFNWHEEPGGTVWTLQKTDEKHLNIKIVSFEDLLRKKEVGVVLNESCSLVEFVDAVVHALDLVLQKHGIDGYKEIWKNHHFPLEQYFKLKAFVNKSNH